MQEIVSSFTPTTDPNEWTHLWRCYHVFRDQYPRVTYELHKKYGPVICVGPGVLDLDHPGVTKAVFNHTKSEWRKTMFYEIAGGKEKGQIVHHIFSERDPVNHACMKRPVAKYYYMPSFVTMESHFDLIVDQFCQNIKTRFIDKNKPFDLGEWLLYFAWDVVGQVTFGKPLGYLEKGCDFDGTIALVPPRMQWLITLGMLPWLAHYVYPIPFLQAPGFDSIIKRSNTHVSERKTVTTTATPPVAADLLDKFLQAKSVSGEPIDDKVMAGWLINNFLAGADSTASGLCSALYFSMKTPGVWQRLRADAVAAGLVSDRSSSSSAASNSPPVSYTEARSLTYLDAVVHEAVRMVPGVSMPLERYVPEKGYNLPAGGDGGAGGNGFLPEGIVVGINPYVVGRNADVFGDDACDFRPERWLQAEGETEEQHQQRLAAMHAANLSFGDGSWSCLGKNMALIQLYKLVATMVVRFDCELVSPEKNAQVTGSWFPRLEGVSVKATDIHLSG
ncbi:cytochrome P450 [Xylariales sp. PMI_506]|nr:cytochrome P450 [Xylariales sp. PMI_506]